MHTFTLKSYKKTLCEASFIGKFYRGLTFNTLLHRIYKANANTMDTYVLSKYKLCNNWQAGYTYSFKLRLSIQVCVKHHGNNLQGKSHRNTGPRTHSVTGAGTHNSRAINSA